MKSRFTRANQPPFINQEIQRAVMVRFKLRKKFLKSRSVGDKKACNKQRTKCVSLLRKTKKACYLNLNVKDIVDNKSFFNMSFFSNKLNNFKKISLIENGKMLVDDIEIVKTFNKYFQHLVPNLDLKLPMYSVLSTLPNTRKW